jgi:hypothetical protein
MLRRRHVADTSPTRSPPPGERRSMAALLRAA